MCALALWPRDLPASIEDQRARLPPAPEPDGCADEVSGVWRAHVYYSRLHDWYRYELRIARQGDALTGTIHLRGWTGTPTETEPPACRPRLRDAEWSEVASGAVTRTPQGMHVRFDATSWRLERTHCGEPGGDYALDHFAGQLDGPRQEFTSINTYTFGNGDAVSPRLVHAPRGGERAATRGDRAAERGGRSPAAAERETAVVLVLSVSVPPTVALRFAVARTRTG
jgi:hypothetical protein